MSKALSREIAGLELMLGQELEPEKKARAEEKLAQLQGKVSQSMTDTVIMEPTEKTNGHTPHGFHRPITAKRSH